MTFRRDATMKNKEASNLNTIFAAGTLKIYTGTQPGSADSAPTGTLLATINLPGTPFSVTGAVASKTGTWSATVSTSGTAGWARMEGIDNANMDFNCTGTGGGGEIELDDVSLVSGGTVSVTSGSITYAGN